MLGTVCGWGPVFEHFFGYNNKTFLQWGDTLSTCYKDMGMTLRLDLRMIATTNSSTMEVSTGEFASFEVIVSLYNYTTTNVRSRSTTTNVKTRLQETNTRSRLTEALGNMVESSDRATTTTTNQTAEDETEDNRDESDIDTDNDYIKQLKAEFQQQYGAMKDENRWKLSTGKIVEDTLYKDPI
ncbi:unnamed protein product [Absidia cylindrospora]